jgi:DNA repair exonuclease SbcCD nuclease subunit
MSRFCFVHAADLHHDTPFEGVGRADVRVRDALRDASLDAWDDLVRLTIDRQAAFLLLAGDIYDGAQRGVRAQLRLRRGLERLAERGIQAFVIHGNHDPTEGWSAIRSWPPLVTVFDSKSVQSAPVERDGQRLATVHGISYAQPAVTENLALRFRRGGEPGLHIGLLHCNVGGNAEHESYSPCTLDDLRRAGMDYWALGHIHQRQVLVEGGPWVVYPGNLQGRSPKASELGPKGAMVVEVDDAGVRGVDFAPVDRVRFARCEVEVSGCNDLAELEAELWRQGEWVRERNEGRGVLLRAVLAGHDGPHADLQRPGVIDELLRDLRQQAEGLTPFLWWQGIQDQTRIGVDRELIRGRGDFSAELIAAVDALAEDPDRRERFIAQRLQALQDRGFHRWIPDVPADEAMDLLREAEDLALNLLEQEEQS